MNIKALKKYEGKYLTDTEGPSISPVTKWLKPKLLFIDENRMVCECEVRQEMADPPGMLHGGIRATMLTDILGIFANALDDKVTAATIGMNIDFIDRAYVGEHVTITAEPVKKGKSLIYMAGSIINTKGKIVAKGTTTLFILSDKIKKGMYKNKG